MTEQELVPQNFESLRVEAENLFEMIDSAERDIILNPDVFESPSDVISRLYSYSNDKSPEQDLLSGARAFYNAHENLIFKLRAECLRNGLESGMPINILDADDDKQLYDDIKMWTKGLVINGYKEMIDKNQVRSGREIQVFPEGFLDDIMPKLIKIQKFKAIARFPKECIPMIYFDESQEIDMFSGVGTHNFANIMVAAIREISKLEMEVDEKRIKLMALSEPTSLFGQLMRVGANTANEFDYKYIEKIRRRFRYRAPIITNPDSGEIFLHPTKALESLEKGDFSFIESKSIGPKRKIRSDHPICIAAHPKLDGTAQSSEPLIRGIIAHVVYNLPDEVLDRRPLIK